MARELQECEMPRIGGRPRDAMTDDELGVNPKPNSRQNWARELRGVQSEMPASVGSESALRGSAKRTTLPLCSR